MRKLIAGMQISLDGKSEGPDGYADWVDEWSDHYDISASADACLLGAGMYPNHERYWTAILNALDHPVPGAKPPHSGEAEYALFTARTPHYVLSNALTSTSWPNTRFVQGLEDVAALKQQPGKDIVQYGFGQLSYALLPLFLPADEFDWGAPIAHTKVSQGHRRLDIE
jgi:hypothetical protein